MDGWKDVTTEFLSANAPVSLALHSTYSLDEVVSSIDLMHAKMDRGLVRIGQESLRQWRHHMLIYGLSESYLVTHAQFEDVDLLLAIMAHIELRISTWMSGAPAADALLPVMILHRPTMIANPTLRWFVIAQLQCAYLLADLMQRAFLCRSDEFMPRLHGILSSEFSNLAAVHSSTLPWIEKHSGAVMELYGSLVSDQCVRLGRWLAFLHSLLASVDLYAVDSASSGLLLATISGGLFRNVSVGTSVLNQKGDDCSLQTEPSADEEGIHGLWMKFPVEYLEREMLIVEPRLANFYSAGCVRRELSFVSERTHVQLPNAWNAMFYVITSRIALISATSSDSLLPSLLVSFLQVHDVVDLCIYPEIAVALDDTTMQRPVRFASVAASLIYLYLMRRFDYHQSISQFALDVLHMALHSPSRQHRLLSKLISRLVDDHETHLASMESQVFCDSSIRHHWTEDALHGRCTCLARILAVWKIIVGFQLDLYESYEQMEAHYLIHLLLPDHLSSLKSLSLSLLVGCGRTNEEIDSLDRPFDLVRVQNRWRGLWKLLSWSTDASVSDASLLLSKLAALDFDGSGSTSLNVFATYQTAFFAAIN